MPRRRSLVRTLRGLLAALLALQLGAPPVATAMPHGAQVVGGAATITQSGSTLHITQGTSKAIINWNGFSIGANELVRFIQPGPTSAMLNRVVGGEASHILGQLLATGRIFLINPNGIIFGAGAQVNVGSLLATTLNISDADFLAGNLVFQREPGNLSTIINQGTLTAADGGFIALSAPGVVNQGIITAKLGTVHLSSGDRLAVDFSGDGLVRFAVSGAVAGVPADAAGAPLPARVSNEGTISATGGDVTLTARAVGDVLTRVVNNSGVIEAGSLVARGGVVRLSASDPVTNTGRLGADVHQGEVRNAAGAVIQSGTIDVSAAEAGAAPGEVTLSGQMVGLSGSIFARGLDGPGGNVLLTTSDRTMATTASLIDASGSGAASAGHVVLWSDDLTLFRGTILARGGALGGDGGHVEISGKERLDFSGFVDTRAPLGTLGSLLLDPKNITVANNGGTPLTGVDEFTDTPGSSVTIARATINNAASNVVLQANNDLTISGAISMSAAGADLTMLAGRSVTVGQNVTTNDGDIFIGANWPTGVDTANRDSGAGSISIASNRTLNAGTGTITLEVQPGGDAGNISAGAMNAGALTLTTPNTISLAGTLRARGGPIDLSGNVRLVNNLTLDTTGNGAVATGGNITVNGTLDSNTTARTLTVTAGTTGDLTFNGAVGAATALSGLTVSSGRDVTLPGTTGTLTGAATFGNTGVLTLGSPGGTLTFGGGLTATAPSSSTVAGTIQTPNDVLRLGAITLADDTTLATTATSGTGDLFLGAVTGNGHDLTLSTGAFAGADANGTSVSGVGTLTLQSIGGRATFTGDVTATTLAVPASVLNVSLLGASGTLTDAVTFANTGNLTMGAVGGTLTFTGGLTATAPLTRTIQGTIETASTPLTLGTVTLNGATTLTTNATTAAGDLTVGAVTGGNNALTLATGAVAGADLAGTSVSGVTTLTLQGIGGAAAFTGAVTASTLTAGNTVNDLSLTGTSGTVTNPVTFDNTGALTLGAAGGTLTFTGGLTATAPASLTLAGIVQTTNTPMTLGAATLGAATTLRTNATSGAGDLTLAAITGNGHALTLSTGSGIGGADVVGSSVSGVSTLTLQNIGGTASFTDAVNATALSVASTVSGLSLTGTSDTITNAVTLGNTGPLTLGSGGGTLTFAGGLTATAPASRTLAGTIETGNAPLVLGAVTLGDDTTLRTNATSTAGDITIGAVTGGGHNLTLATGAGVANANVSGTTVSGVDTLRLQDIGGTAAFTGPVSAATLVVEGSVNNVSLTASSGTIANTATFANTGALTLGTTAGTLSFNGGLTATAPSLTTTAGTIQTQSTPLTLGAISLGAATRLTTNATDAGGDIVLGAVTGNGRALTLSTGAGVSGADVTGATVSGVSTLTLQDIGGTVTFTGPVSGTTMVAGPSVNNVSLLGLSGTFTNAVTLANAGTLTLGSAGGTLTFGGGLTATAPALSVIAGTIATTNDPLTFGAISLGADAVLRTNATSSAGDLTVGAVTGNGHALTLATGGAANADLSGAGVSGVGTLTVQNIGGTAAFTGAVSPVALVIGNTVNDLSLTGNGTVTDPVTFGNSGALTLGGAGGTLTFTGGLTATAPASLLITGIVQTMDAPLVLGAITLGGDATLRTNATTGAGDLTLGAVTGGGHALTLSTGAGVAGADLAGASVTGAGALALQNIGGTATFSGAVDATTLTVAGTVNSVALTGASGTIANAVTFDNIGTLTLGSAGTLTFAGGLAAAGPSAITLNGTVVSAGDVDLSATGPITLGTLQSGGDVTIASTAGSVLAIPGGTNITATGAVDVGALGGTIGVPGTPLTVAITGSALMNATGLDNGAAIVANGTVGSVVPLFPSTVVGAVLWNGVDLNIPAPVVTPPPPPGLSVDPIAIVEVAGVAPASGLEAPAAVAVQAGTPDTGLPFDPVTILTLISDVLGGSRSTPAGNGAAGDGGPLAETSSDEAQSPIRQRSTGVRLPGGESTLPAGPLRPWNSDREP